MKPALIRNSYTHCNLLTDSCGAYLAYPKFRRQVDYYRSYSNVFEAIGSGRSRAATEGTAAMRAIDMLVEFIEAEDFYGQTARAQRDGKGLAISQMRMHALMHMKKNCQPGAKYRDCLSTDAVFKRRLLKIIGGCSIATQIELQNALVAELNEGRWENVTPAF